MKTFLTASEVKILKVAHRALRNKRRADRIKTILSLNEGFSYSQIAKILLLDDSTLRDYYQQYRQGGLNILLEDHYSERAATKLTVKQEKELKNYLDKNLYTNARKIVEYVKEKYAVLFTVSEITALLHKLGFVYKKTKQVPGKADEEKQRAFIKEYEKIKRKKGKDDIIYFADASHPQHNSLPAYGWILKGKTKELKSNTGRKRLNLHGALNLEEIDVVIREDKTINYISTINLYRQLEEKHPKGTIWVIEDNASYYKKKEVQDYLKTSRVKIIFLPAYAPNLNIIERLWKFMHEEILYNEYYSSFLEFKDACMNFFDNIGNYKKELEKRLADNFEIVPSWSSESHLR